MSGLAEHIADVPLVDHHVHGYWLQAGGRARFENGLNEGNVEPLAAFDSAFDTQLGFAVRTHCAPLLELPRHVDPQAYWERRVQLSEPDLARRFLSGAGVSDWLVDTGLSEGVADVSGVAAAAGGHAHEVVRLETVADDAAQASGDYASAFEDILHRRAVTAVGTKSIPGRRLTDRVLLRFGLHRALTLGKPLQLHVGFGDRDADLHKTNPLYLPDFLRHSGNSPITLLHCYPYEGEAGYLAQAFNNVYIDGGLAINYLGARSRAFIARLREMAPFRNILYSSDAFGPAELHYLGARLWRNGIRDTLQCFVDADEWSEADAIRVVDLIAYRNAARILGLAGHE